MFAGTSQKRDSPVVYQIGHRRGQASHNQSNAVPLTYEQLVDGDELDHLLNLHAHLVDS